MRRLIFLVILLWPVADLGAESASVRITYNITAKGLESATIESSVVSPDRPIVVIVVLPFHASARTWSEPGIMGVINRPSCSWAIIQAARGKTSIRFEVPIDAGSPLKEGARLRQAAHDDFLLVPPLDEGAVTQAAELAETAGGIVANQLSVIQARLDPGFVVLTDGLASTLIDYRTFSMVQGQSGIHQLVFRRPTSVAEDAIQGALGALLLAVFGLLLAYAAPGLLPQGYATLIITITVILAVGLVCVRWWFADRSRQALIAAIVDTSVASLYFLGLGVVWLMRKRKARAGGVV